MEKVKLTEWQKDAIEDLEQEYLKGNIVRQHVLGRWGDAYNSLNKLNLDEIVRALYVGYEVELPIKVGDWIFNCKTGEISKVIRIDSDYAEVEEQRVFMFDYSRHATPEEIKAEQERRVWSEIGREVGEFRDGDAAVADEGNVLRNPDNIQKHYACGKLTGFYPAESFISFGGESE